MGDRKNETSPLSTATKPPPQSPASSHQPNVIQIPVNIPLPSRLELSGNLAANWMKFYRDWANYKIATRLKDTGHPPANKELGTPTLLTYIGSDALETA